MRVAVRNVLAVLLVTGSAIALPAQAGHHGHDRWNRHNDYQNYNRDGYGNHGGHNNYGYNNYGYNDSYGGRHHRSHGRHHGREVAFLAGGLIVGSLLSNA